MQNANSYNENPNYGKDFSRSVSGEQDFRLMNISVSVLGLSGIYAESKKKQKIFHKKQKSRSSSEDKGYTESSSSSLEMEDNNVKAVVTFFKNSMSSDTFIASHLPSLPIRSIDGGNSHYHATWPTDFDPNGNELSTFKISRLMKPDYGQQRYLGGVRGKKIFVPEEIVLTVGLNKGSDMIPLGTASIFITGEECEDIQCNLPVRLEAVTFQNGKKSKSTVNKIAIKPTAFPKHPKTKYSLQNACLKILLRTDFDSPQPSVTSYSQDDNYVMGMHGKDVSYGTHTPNRMDHTSYHNPNFTPGSSVGAVFPQENHENYPYNSSFDETYYDDATTAYTPNTEKTGSSGILHTFLDRFSSLCSAFSTPSNESKNTKKRRNDDNWVNIDGYEDRRYTANYGRRSKSVKKNRIFGDDHSFGPNSAHSVATQATQKIQNGRRDDEGQVEDLENYQRGRQTEWL